MESQIRWAGVFSATTTPFTGPRTGEVDFDLLTRHVIWQVDNGVQGLMANGSLGSGRLTSLQQKAAIARAIFDAVGGRVPVVGTIYQASTAEALELAALYRDIGMKAAMLLPPKDAATLSFDQVMHYLHEVIDGCGLEVMFYQNPAYLALTAEQIASLAKRHANLMAVKDSSGRCGFLTALSLACPRLALFHGLDTMVMEPGAHGWVSGLTCFAPRQAVDLWTDGNPETRLAQFRRLYPLLALDIRPGAGFIEAITAAQRAIGFSTHLCEPYDWPADRTDVESLASSLIGVEVPQTTRASGPGPMDEDGK